MVDDNDKIDWDMAFVVLFIAGFIIMLVGMLGFLMLEQLYYYLF